MTLEQMLAQGARRFTDAGLHFGHGTDNAGDEALMLALYALDLDYDCDAGILQKELSDGEISAIEQLFEQRIRERRPAAYLTGKMWFAGMPFYVDSRVLVPRSPLAELIVNRFEPWVEPGKVHRILHMCTGSGCIAIACARYFPDARVDASDLSEDALAVAKINIEKHDLQDRVHLIHSDLFRSVSESAYDIIVSNPPYVSRAEMGELPEEYLREPSMGLESGDDGLDAVRGILEQSASHLAPGGILVCEVGYSQQALIDAFPEAPFLWIEFEYGGEGVFMLTREQLIRFFN